MASLRRLLQLFLKRMAAPVRKARRARKGEWLIEAKVTSTVLGFVDDIVVRVTDEGESTYVDMRAHRRFGAYDLGANARRIVEFMNALDTRIQTTPPG